MTIVESGTHKSIQTGAWEKEIVLQLQTEVILLGCQVFIVAIEEGLHCGRLRLFGAGCYERAIVVRVARTCLIATIQRYAKNATHEIQMARQTGCYLAGVQLLLTIVGVEVGGDVALLPMVACCDGPGGQFVTDAQVEGVVNSEVAPRFLATFCRVIVFVVGGSILIGQSAIGVDAVLQLLALIFNIEAEPRYTEGVGEASLKRENVAIVVSIGDGVLRLATIVARSVAVGSGEEDG